MQHHFLPFRRGIIGLDEKLQGPDGEKRKLVYADWTASGRNYLPIEKRLQEDIMPLVANTHTETSSTGMAMTFAYHQAQAMIKKYVNASSDDVIITAGSGMTRLINKLQRIMGLRVYHSFEIPAEDQRPVVFITHMEHHSNHTSWLETIARVEIIQPDENGEVDLENFRELLPKYKDAPLKIASVTACSNVTGIITPYRKIARMIHKVGGICFVDFACSAPYVEIDMHPEEEGSHLDAMLCSPHKFLGGPGSAAVLVFNKKLYDCRVPDHPGGGTVDWTNPWGKHKYVESIEEREDGGTPAFLQTIKTALCFKLKEEMGVENIMKREEQMLDLIWDRLASIPKLHVLAPQHRERLPIISFYIEDLHYNLAVKLLNDKFGIQCRGGCSCAGTYGHYLLNVDPGQSKEITDLIDRGDYSKKPGWVRISLHPTMTDEEVFFIAESLEVLARNHHTWSEEYIFDPSSNSLRAREQKSEEEILKRMERALQGSFTRDGLFELRV